MIFEAALVESRTRSCGCTRGAHITQAKRRHGEAAPRERTPEYRIWANMMTRCYNEANRAYAAYGGRSIHVCARWHRYELFLKDMGRKPPDHSLDRRNNNGNYSPRNCRWATREQQANNTRRTVRITFQGRTQSLAQWSRETGISRHTLSGRLRRGWAPGRVLSSTSWPVREQE